MPATSHVTSARKEKLTSRNDEMGLTAEGGVYGEPGEEDFTDYRRHGRNLVGFNLNPCINLMFISLFGV